MDRKLNFLIGELSAEYWILEIMKSLDAFVTRGSENQLYLNTFYWGEEGETRVKQRKNPLQSICKIPYDISMVENTEQGGEKVGQNLNNERKVC